GPAAGWADRGPGGCGQAHRRGGHGRDRGVHGGGGGGARPVVRAAVRTGVGPHPGGGPRGHQPALTPPAPPGPPRPPRASRCARATRTGGGGCSHGRNTSVTVGKQRVGSLSPLFLMKPRS